MTQLEFVFSSEEMVEKWIGVFLIANSNLLARRYTIWSELLEIYARNKRLIMRRPTSQNFQPREINQITKICSRAKTLLS